MGTKEYFSNTKYQQLLESLENCIFPNITSTESQKGQYREADFYQIDHGTGHLNRVRENMERLLECVLSIQDPPNQMEDSDIFVALASASFHDMGMHFGWNLLNKSISEPLTGEPVKRIRDKHGFISAEWFRKAATSSPPLELQLSPDLKILLSDAQLNNRLTFVIEHYDKPMIKNPDNPKPTLGQMFKERNIDEKEQKRVRFLCYLLRLSDIFDMDQRRVQVNRIKSAIDHWRGYPSQIRPNIEEITRLLMCYYCWKCNLSITSLNHVIFKIDPRVPSSMLNDPDYQPFLDHLNTQYNQRLRDRDDILATIYEFSNMVIVPIKVTDFQGEADQLELDKQLLKPILARLSLFEVF